MLPLLGALTARCFVGVHPLLGALRARCFFGCASVAWCIVGGIFGAILATFF